MRKNDGGLLPRKVKKEDVDFLNLGNWSGCVDRATFWFLVTCLAVASNSGRSEENTTTVAQMQEYCSHPDGHSSKTYCYTYLGGFVDGAITAGMSVPLFCMPNSVTNKELALIFSKWADANPERHHLPMTLGIVSAIAPAFPCKRG